MESMNTKPQKPAGEDASAPQPPVVMDPSLLMAASMGDCEALKSLLNWGDATVWPKRVASQVVVEVPVDGDTLDHGITNGSLDVQQQASARAIEEGAGNQPAASAESLLQGVTPLGDTALHVLAKSEMSEVLLSWNKELAKKQCYNGNTPLHLHIFWGDVLVPILLEANLSAAYQPNKSGSFPIHIAALKGRLQAFISLLKMCPECVNLCDTMGRTFLHVAVDNQIYSIVSYACGTPSAASILNTQDNDGNTMLHLAVQAEDLRMVCLLLGEVQVQLNIANNSGRTPRDLAWCRLPHVLYYAGNPQVIIYRLLGFAGAMYGCYGASFLDKQAKPQLENDRESEVIKDSTQTLGIGSVLIVTVAFGATFVLPGGYRADDHPNGGTPTLAGRYAFDAFITAITLAFVCASVATMALMFSGMAMVDLALRRKHFNYSVFFAGSSVISLGASFALGLYMVLAPVAHSTAIAVLVVTFAVMTIGIIKALDTLKIIRALRPRLGKGIWRIVAREGLPISIAFWPFIIIFGWPVYSTNYRHN